MDLRYAVLALAAAPPFGIACSSFGTAPDADAGASAEASVPLDVTTATDGAVVDRALPSSLDPDVRPPGELDASVEDSSLLDTSRVDAGLAKKRVFLTEATFPGTFASGTTVDAQLEADARCATEARALGSTWYAYLSVPTVSAGSRLPDGASWRLPGVVAGTFGALVFPSRAAIVLGPEEPIVLGANGLPAVAPGLDDAVWTGTFADGTIDFAGHCNSWAGGTEVDHLGRIGSAGGLRGNWSSAGAASCQKTARFYCFEQ
ncbi:MAG: hypothetical protein IPF92_26295 [Myxococcales bacterium]|jgi:hypothetical protein|nr:hypothetical protein [Myxococcales bacterium]MBL0194225.1 hypothetical protein [Myxococcales bacterium]HQY62379.1 hypothetical protein [Polyangiaceae bacterium]